MNKQIEQIIAKASEIIDRVIKTMLERNGFTISDLKKYDEVFRLQEELRRRNCSLIPRDNRYELWEKGALIDKVEIKFDFVLDSDIAKYGATIRIT